MFTNINRNVSLRTALLVGLLSIAVIVGILAINFDDGWVATISLTLAYAGALGIIFGLFRTNEISIFEIGLVAINMASLFLSAKAVETSDEGVKGFFDFGINVGLISCLVVLATMFLLSRIVRRIQK